MRQHAFLTATPPTPNGGLHVGHLAGPYIAADVLRRHLVASGVQAALTTGMDDHQTYVPRAALQAGRDPGELADDYGDSIDATWKAAGVEFDVSVRPRRDAAHTELTQQFFRTLYDDGHLVARRKAVPWCEDCRRWLVEAWVSGGCPHCGRPSGGNACEDCGRPNHCGDLVDPHCVLCGAPGTLREVERLFFPLARLEGELIDFWSSTRIPPHLRALCETMVADGLPEIAVTQLTDWGIPVPVDGYDDQRIYVWFEMAPGYLHEARRAAEGIGLASATSLTSDPSVPFVQFFGFDNGYFHAVLFPALFRAYDRALRLPTQFIVNEFYRLDGQKFSTSRRHAVWAADLLTAEDADVVRWHVLGDRPEGRQTNFTLEGLARTRARLQDLWDAPLDQVVAACGGRVPSERPAGPDWETLQSRLLRTAAELRDAYGSEGFDPRRAVMLLDGALSALADFAYVYEHTAGIPAMRTRHRAALTAQLTALRALAAWSAPIVPGIADRVALLLGYTGPMTAVDEALKPPPPGLEIPRASRPQTRAGSQANGRPSLTAVGG